MSDTGPATWQPQVGPQMPMTRIEPGQQRIGDRDRHAVAEHLADAYSQGMLTADEYDQRTHSAYSAVVLDDLAPLTADLHRARRDTPIEDTQAAAHEGRELLRATTILWICASVFSLVVWGLLSVIDARVAYPGYVWVIAPTGSVLAVLWAACYPHRHRHE